jgi:phosphomannomutase
MVHSLVVATLNAMGVDVVDLGLSTTPTVEMAVVHHKAMGGIIVTASHNPQQWNALKMLNEKGEFISAAISDEILRLSENNAIEYQEMTHLGRVITDEEALQRHVESIRSLSLVDCSAIEKAGYTVVVDAVNSTGAIAVPALLRALGVKKIILINGEVNGHFAHNPEPLPEHLVGLSREVKRRKAHLGIAVDPDVDRLAIVCEDGEMFGEEYTLVAVADYVLQHKKGDTVSNLSSTRALRDITEQHGCRYFYSAVGEVHVVEKMKETRAVIGGEGNGGIILPELHYGRDALAGIALFLSALARSGKTCSIYRARFPDYFISKNKIELTAGINADNIMEKIKGRYQKYPLITIDGIKIEFDRDWVHLRKSNTEPIIRIYAESSSQTTADNLARKLMADIRELAEMK